MLKKQKKEERNRLRAEGKPVKKKDLAAAGLDGGSEAVAAVAVSSKPKAAKNTHEYTANAGKASAKLPNQTHKDGKHTSAKKSKKTATRKEEVNAGEQGMFSMHTTPALHIFHQSTHGPSTVRISTV